MRVVIRLLTYELMSYLGSQVKLISLGEIRAAVETINQMEADDGRGGAVTAANARSLRMRGQIRERNFRDLRIFNGLRQQNETRG